MSRTRMLLLFLIILLFAVYAEFVVIINVSNEIGAAATLLAMFATAVIGLWLVRLQGFDVYRKMSQTMHQGKSPVGEMLHGVLLLFAGFLLIIPGFISDGVGALLLIPPIRGLIISMGLWKYFGNFEVKTGGVRRESDIIEGEFNRKDEPENDAPAIDHKTDNK